MSPQNTGDENPILAAWQHQLQHASTNVWLMQLLLKQMQRVLKRLAYFYAQLASLPRRNRRALQRALATSLIGAAMLLAFSGAPVVHAATITVDGTCTLADAITAANTDTATGSCPAGDPGADTLDLQVNVTLAGYLPDITSEITLEGNNFYVSGANTYRVFFVTSTGDFTINDTTVKDGYTGGRGGGIYNYNGTLELNGSTVSGNFANLYGGGIMNYAGDVTLNDSTVDANTAGYWGGGLYNNFSGTITLNNSTVSGNEAVIRTGGGIYNRRTLTLNNSTISGNTAGGNGGGIYNGTGTTLAVNNSTVSGNSGPSGGGIFNYNGGTATLNNSTVSGNSGTSRGGGIFTNGTLELNNSTVSGNYGVLRGGGIYNRRTPILNNSTVSGNSANDNGGGIHNRVRSGGVYLHRSLVSGNTATSSSDEIYSDRLSPIYSNDYNLFGHDGEMNADAFYGFTPGALDFNATSDGDGVSTHVPTALASILDTTLALNGGTTENHALVTGSPALDKAPNLACFDPPINDVDQRGFPRNVDINGGNPSYLCDIGSFELQLSTAVNVTNLRAIAKDDKNVLKWRTTSESQIAGFNVWRRNGQGEWKQINANFKQAKHSGDAQGDKYAYRDKKVKDGNTYRYKIQVKYLDGHDEWTEVVRVRVP